MRRSLAFSASVLLFLACGSPEPSNPASAKNARQKEKKVAASSEGKSRPLAKPKPSEPKTLPKNCDMQGELCALPMAFVERLCASNYPDVAVYMMRNDQPWTHRFVLVEQAQAVNPYSGRVGEEKLAFGEEVIVLRYREGEARSGLQVSGTERYELLRWDGSCATLAEGELVEKVPKKQWRYVAPIWKRLGDEYRKIFREDEGVAAAEARKQEDCKGVGLGRPPKCYKAMEELNRAVADAVRSDIDLPLPSILP